MTINEPTSNSFFTVVDYFIYIYIYFRHNCTGYILAIFQLSVANSFFDFLYRRGIVRKVESEVFIKCLKMKRKQPIVGLFSIMYDLCVISGCGWTSTSTFDGMITSPAYPYTSIITQPINCVWRVTMPSQMANFVTELHTFNFPRTNYTANENCTNVNTVLQIDVLDQNGAPLPYYGNGTGSIRYCADSSIVTLPMQQNTQASQLVITLQHTPLPGSSSYSGFQLHYSATFG